jgi:hypothetical protein
MKSEKTFSRFTLKTISILMFCSIHLMLAGQGNDFSNLPAKERAEMARQEMMQAATDQEFLQLMDEGHELFVKKHYLRAITQYEKAGQHRPLNVYPPVIIRDIELSMKDTLKLLREEAKKNVAEKLPERPTEPEFGERDEAMSEFRKKEEQRQEKVGEWEEKERKQLAKQRELKKNEEEEQRELADSKSSDVAEAGIAEFQKDLATQYGEGITQRTYNEGNRTITERIVVKGDTGNEYKRVTHPWGGKFYFKNGTPISEDTWNNETQ